MAAASDYLEKAILDHVFKVAAFTQPTSIYISLHTGSPADDDSGANEVTGTSYARVDASSSWAAASSPAGTITTNADITFPAAGAGGWGTVTHIGIYDGNTGTDNLLFHGALAASKTVAESDIFQITSGNLTITLA